MVLGHLGAILGGTRFYFGEFNCWKICSFSLGDLYFFVGTVYCWEICSFLLGDLKLISFD